MVTSKCEAEIGLFLTATPKKKERKKERREERGEQEGVWVKEKSKKKRERKSGKAYFFVSKW